MFQYEIDKFGKYWIWSDKIKGKFGPFDGIYIKNSIYGDFPREFDISSYPGYKFSIGFSGTNFFVIGIDGVENILSK